MNSNRYNGLDYNMMFSNNVKVDRESEFIKTTSNPNVINSNNLRGRVSKENELRNDFLNPKVSVSSVNNLIERDRDTRECNDNLNHNINFISVNNLRKNSRECSSPISLSLPNEVRMMQSECNDNLKNTKVNNLIEKVETESENVEDILNDKEIENELQELVSEKDSIEEIIEIDTDLKKKSL